MSRWSVALFAGVSLVGFPCFAETALDAEIHWVTRTSAAFAEASRSGKPVLLDLWAIWCEPCKEMDETTYRDAGVIQAIEHFVPLKINVDANELLVERYEVDGFPATLFLDKDGGEIARRGGLLQADELLEALEMIREGYGSYLSNLEKRDDPTALKEAAEFLSAVGNDGGAAKLLRSALKTAKKNGSTELESIELDLALALLADGQVGAAVKTMERLSVSAVGSEVRGRALVGLVRAERERGHEKKAEQALARLRDEYPQLASSAQLQP